VGSILVFEAIIVISLIHAFYKKPIHELKHLIQKFYVWELKGKDISVEKSKNPDVNYIITFFVKTLDTLKNIKDEFFHGKEIKWEVEIWKEIQWKMLGKKLLEVPSLNVVAKSRPAWEIGWDSYDIIQQWDNYYIYVWDRVKSGWVALWMIKNIHKLIKEQQVQFEPNDIIVLYSDGITEAINRPSKDWKEEMFGEDNLQRVIEEAPNVKWQQKKSARTVFNHISIELSRFMGYKHAQFDDITLTTIEYKTEDYDESADIPLEIPNTFMTEWKW